MIHPIWIVAFAGHRPGDGPGRSQAELAACRPRVEEVLNQLSAKAARAGGSIELLTCVAAGADIETAEVARELGIPIHLIIPTPISRFCEDFGGDLTEYWPRAERLIEDAQDEQHSGSFRVANGSASAPDCYHDATIQMVRSTDLLIAVWNGEPALGLGGTREFIEEAGRLEIPVALINPATNDAPQFVGNWRNWPQPDAVISKLNKDVFGERSMPVVPTDGSSQRDPNAVFTMLDEAANRFGKNFRGRLWKSVILHFLAGILAAFTASFSPLFHDSHSSESVEASTIGATEHTQAREGDSKEGHPILSKENIPKMLTIVELIFVSIALYLMAKSVLSHDHHKWRRARFAAELIRSARPSLRHLDPLRPMIGRHEPDWRRFSLSTTLAAHNQSRLTSSLEEQKASYLKDRICDQRDHYFGKVQPTAKIRNHVLSRLGLTMSVAAPFLILFALILKCVISSGTIDGSKTLLFFVAFLPIVLPLTAGVATTLVVATDVGRRAERYRNLGERLDQLARIIPGIRTPTAFSSVVAETEEILLDELIEWYAASQNVGH